MSNILLCDANFCLIPIFQAIKTKPNSSLSVIGSILSDPLHSLADKSINLDYSDTNSLSLHIHDNNYDNIIPGCNDRAYISLAKIADKTYFPGFDNYATSLNIHHKDKFRALAEKFNYPIPKAINTVEKINQINFPVLIKPIDSFSGKGINKANNIHELHDYWEIAEQCSSSGLAIAEEFIEGNLYSHSAFIKNRKIIIDFFVNEYCTVYPYQVNSSNIATLLNKKIEKELRDWVEKFANDLELCDGLIHTQFISDNEEFTLIEIARRCPGDLYSQLIQKSTGINYAELYILPFLGIELPNKVEIQEEKFISRHTVSTDEECIFLSSSINLQCLKVENIQLKNSGEKMKRAPFDKSGIYFIEHESKEDMEELTKKLKDFVVIDQFTI